MLERIISSHHQKLVSIVLPSRVHSKKHTQLVQQNKTSNSHVFAYVVPPRISSVGIEAAPAFEDFLKAYRCHFANRNVSADLLEPQVQSSLSHNLQDAPKRVPCLGNFEAVYKGLTEFDRLQLQRRREKQKYVENALDEYTPPEYESSSPDSDLEPSSMPSDPLDNRNAQPKEVRWEDEINNSYVHMGKAQGKDTNGFDDLQKSPAGLKICLGFDKPTVLRRRESSHEARRGAQVSAIYEQTGVEDYESNTYFMLDSTLATGQRPDLVTPQRLTTVHRKPRSAIAASQLTPAWVTPIPVRPGKSPSSGPRETHFAHWFNTTHLIYMTKEQKKAAINAIFSRKFGPWYFGKIDKFYAINANGGDLSDNGIHVFVDGSNITIGFYDSIRAVKDIDLGYFGHQGRRPPLSFHSLALIMERGRYVAKRILVGSSDGLGARPEYMNEADQCGYEVNALERVGKLREHWHRRRESYGNGYGTSGQSSGSESGRAGKIRFSEQAVDEILHMKMLESMLDYAEGPSTIVLATGDAAEAEFSGGFLLMVKRALVRGWKVELVAWGHSMSHLYRSDEFLLQCKEQFMIIELEDFAKLLLADFKVPSYAPKGSMGGEGIQGLLKQYSHDLFENQGVM